MQTRTVKYAIGALLGLALLACARGGEAFDGEQPFALKETCLHIDLNFAGEAPSKAADSDTPEEVGGKAWENDIQTLSVFVRNRYDDTWAWDTIVRLYNVQQNKDYEVRLNKPLTASTELYAAANISTAQETAFMQQVDNKEAYTLPGNDFRLVEDLAPYSTSATARRNTIAMCCTGAAQAQATEGEEENHFKVAFTLKRLVAKVLVTCEEDKSVTEGKEGETYAFVKEDGNFKGWIRMSSLRYALNGLNRKTYILQQIEQDVTDTDANVTDPNPDLTKFDTEESTLSDFYSFPLGRTGKEGEYEKVLPASQKDYYEGIYCPENTFYPEDTFEEGQWMMITHVVISAVFTPKVLWVEYGLFDYIAESTGVSDEQKKIVAALKESVNEVTEVVEVTCPTEETAQLLLTESLRRASRLLDMDKSHTDAERFFKEASYFYHNAKEEFYTYGATMSALNIEEGNELELDDLEKFGNYVPYNGGQGYYYTYIDNRHPDKKEEPFAFYKHGQVERNRYYILTINSFSNPGASFTNPDYIEVHTRTLNWENGGEGTTGTLGPGNNVTKTRRQP